MPKALAHKPIIITGASSGIGAALAVSCAQAGMPVVLNARRREKLEAVAERVREAGGEVELVAGDVTEAGVNERLLRAADERFGGYYAVLANAGYGENATVVEMEEGAIRRMFEANFFAATFLLKLAAGELLAAGKPGHLLMTSSCLAKFTMPRSGVYSATKAAQNHICRALRLELKGTGIEVSSVHPIGTRTEFFEVAAGDGDDTETGGTPAWLMQPAERVAAAIVRCLRHPRPEVWTSWFVRLGSGLVTAFPRLADRVTAFQKK